MEEKGIVKKLVRIYDLKTITLSSILKNKHLGDLKKVSALKTQKSDSL